MGLKSRPSAMKNEGGKIISPLLIYNATHTVSLTRTTLICSNRARSRLQVYNTLSTAAAALTKWIYQDCVKIVNAYVMLQQLLSNPLQR